MVLSKVVLLALLLSLSCLWVAKASERRTRVSQEVRDAKKQRGGPCTDENTCHQICPDCIIAQCIFKQCVCSKCFLPPSQAAFSVKTLM
ncbi:unnamed protein product [Arabidopsis lyrata]|uniref:Uncharacterized protein n=2 Tax=Arabidopsis lyrata subsp. lyrata TaxID=81972 RepID=D7M1M1_ARALL|nr:hypothetical protein ARALYDRAFT_326601 [Arabidopsis lyrata subsp. lyrata]CAH8271937.1 unnamed protein product [Arabidopsis lyrata]